MSLEQAPSGCSSCGAVLLELNCVRLLPPIADAMKTPADASQSMKGPHRSVEQPAEGVWLSVYQPCLGYVTASDTEVCISEARHATAPTSTEAPACHASPLHRYREQS